MSKVAGFCIYIPETMNKHLQLFFLALPLFCAACSSLPPQLGGSNPTEVSSQELTYRGLSLTQWWGTLGVTSIQVITLDGPPRLTRTTGNYWSTEVEPLLEALGYFAQHSEEAVDKLKLLGKDLDQSVLRSAGEGLAYVALGSFPTRDAARTALYELLLGNRFGSLLIAEEIIVQWLDDEVDPEEQNHLGDDLSERIFHCYLRFFPQIVEEEHGIETALYELVYLSPQVSNGTERIQYRLQECASLWKGQVEVGNRLTEFVYDTVQFGEDSARPGLGIALGAARAACEINPKDSEAWCSLAFVCWRLGERQEAMRAVQRCIELDPDQRQPLEVFKNDSSWTPEARASDLLRYIY